MDLRGVLVVSDIEPEARNAWDVRAARIGLQPQYVRVKFLGLGHVFRIFANTNAMVMQFKHFNGHGSSPCAGEQGGGAAHSAPDVVLLFCLPPDVDSSSFYPCCLMGMRHVPLKRRRDTARARERRR